LHHYDRSFPWQRDGVRSCLLTRFIRDAREMQVRSRFLNRFMVREAAQERYRGTGAESRWKSVVSHCLLGEEPSPEKLGPYLQEQAALTEISASNDSPAAPPLAGLLPKIRSRSQRERPIAKAHVNLGYPQPEIAAHVGLRQSTMSRIVQREKEKSRNKT